MSFTVKAYLYLGKTGHSDTEIRRFSWETNGTFSVLQGKVAQVFPTLEQSNAKFTLFWKDAEGDHIAFSSDEELKEALRNAENNIFKIYIAAGKGTQPSSTSGKKGDGNATSEETKEETDDGPHHPHIVCDGCEGSVRGVRFKCKVCPDYDLCRKCKRQGKHPEHPMTAIRKPMPHPWAGVFVNGRHFGGPCSGGSPHFGPPPPFCPPPPCGPEGAGGPGCHGPQMPGFTGTPPNFNGPWGRFFRRQMRKFWREQGKQQEKGADGKTADEKEPNEEEEEDDVECSPEEYLQNVGEQVAAMLDPLGIDVQVDVEHATAKPQTCGKGGKCGRGNPMDAGQGGSSHSNSDENEWTLVTPDASAPQEEDEDEEPSHNGIPLLEPKIAHALNQMKAMGFSDDGGWLSRLLIAKDGDIGQVLDALKPSLNAQNMMGDHVA
ncbi:sequestosome-1-like [Lineus longissimus]|uniref:sequestosome-1-like n=1 Tax=Lineus longissimus TaxID=88925 RepID=UPI002B4C4AF1